MYEGFLVDVYVSVVVMLALVALYLVSGKPVQKKRTMGNVIPLLHGSSKPCAIKDIPRSKVVYIGIASIEGAPFKKVYLKEYML